LKSALKQKTCESLDLQVLTRFRVFEKIDKVAFFTSFLLFVGRAGFEPAKFSQQIYSLPSLAA
jgi:hypothetical protein